MDVCCFICRRRGTTQPQIEKEEWRSKTREDMEKYLRKPRDYSVSNGFNQMTVSDRKNYWRLKLVLEDTLDDECFLSPHFLIKAAYSLHHQGWACAYSEMSCLENANLIVQEVTFASLWRSCWSHRSPHRDSMKMNVSEWCNCLTSYVLRWQIVDGPAIHSSNESGCWKNRHRLMNMWYCSFCINVPIQLLF